MRREEDIPDYRVHRPQRRQEAARSRWMFATASIKLAVLATGGAVQRVQRHSVRLSSRLSARGSTRLSSRLSASDDPALLKSPRNRRRSRFSFHGGGSEGDGEGGGAKKLMPFRRAILATMATRKFAAAVGPAPIREEEPAQPAGPVKSRTNPSHREMELQAQGDGPADEYSSVTDLRVSRESADEWYSMRMSAGAQEDEEEHPTVQPWTEGLSLRDASGRPGAPQEALSNGA